MQTDNLDEKKEIFWLFNELQQVLTCQKSVKEVWNLIQNGNEAVWKPEDPLPFLILHYVQMPFLLVKATLTGQEWTKVNFCLGQVL